MEVHLIKDVDRINLRRIFTPIVFGHENIIQLVKEICQNRLECRTSQ